MAEGRVPSSYVCRPRKKVALLLGLVEPSRPSDERS
jgi:hypothetical protein